LKDTSLSNKIISLCGGIIFFLVILPALLIAISLFLRNAVAFETNRNIEYTISAISIIFGIFMLSWATVSQWKRGKGTPAPNTPTKHLVVSAPYNLCRNPIELGAIFYYLGMGTLFGGIIAGFACFVLGFIIGSSYHKFIEEKELELRFGNEYKEYKKKTPFLFPKISYRNKRT
jgi:protein-S-isoprenylcysteine O-methyltransferase Ste14